jgi:hypothetical protein
MQSNLNIVVSKIENWLRDQELYYAMDENTYFKSFKTDIGQLELVQLPKAWTGLLVTRQTQSELFSGKVIGSLKLDGQTIEKTVCRVTQIAKINTAEVYGHLHAQTLTSAVLFAAKHHQTQKRKASGEPYINHLLEVLQLLVYFEPESDESTKIAAILHDIVEDTTATLESVEFLFGSDVATLVLQLTCIDAKDSNEKKAKLLQQISVADPRAKKIKLADVTSNVISIPSDWAFERKRLYVAWCKEVVQKCGVDSTSLYVNFNSVISNFDIN